MTDLLPDGVYLDLEADDYFRQGLGSTDLVRLFEAGEGWWWSSDLNPRHKPPKTTPERTFGSAAHALILEGADAYQERFVVSPDYDAIEGLCTSTEDIKGALVKAGYDIGRGSGTSSWKADDWRRCARECGIPVKVNIESDFLDRLIDRHPVTGEVLRRRSEISADDDAALRFMADMALDPGRDDNIDIRALFSRDGDHPPLTEISVIKTLEDGTRRRWRIDRMFPSFDADLKTIGPWKGGKLPWTTGQEIAKRNMDVQRYDYHTARAVAYEFIRDGFQVYGGTIEQRNFIRQFPEIAPTWNWAWIFYQKPDPVAGRAPIIFPVIDITEDDEGQPSDLMISGAAKVRKALATYRRCMATYGPDHPWGRVEPLHYTAEVRGMPNLPRVFIPHWIADGTAPSEQES